MKELETRAGWLDYHVLHRYFQRNGAVKEISIENINVEVVQQKIVETQIPVTNTCVNGCVAHMTESLYECVKAVKNPRQ